MRFLLASLGSIFLFASCSTLPRPGADAGPVTPGDAQALLRQSARAHGDPPPLAPSVREVPNMTQM
jgi:hypothetical protein